MTINERPVGQGLFDPNAEQYANIYSQSGADAMLFWAISMVIIMLLSLVITHLLTTPPKKKNPRYWIPTSSNIKPNINSFK